MLSEIVLSSPGRVLFSIYGFEIYTYGVIMAIAVFVSIGVSNYFAGKAGKFPKDIFIDTAPVLILTGLLGARIWYCALNYLEFLQNPLEILNFRSGGISIHGAILGGFIGLLLYCRIKKIKLIPLCDYSVLGLSLGQAIGRWGNFFNNEAFGTPSDFWLKLYIPPAARPQEFLRYDFFHAAFLYESIADLVLFLVLVYILKYCKNLNTGTLTLVYLILYSIIRFFIELIRVDADVFVFGLPFPAFISLIIFIIALIILMSTFHYKIQMVEPRINCSSTKLKNLPRYHIIRNFHRSVINPIFKFFKEFLH